MHTWKEASLEHPYDLRVSTAIIQSFELRANTPMKNLSTVTCVKFCTPAKPIVKIPQQSSNVANHLDGRTYRFMIQFEGTSKTAYATANRETAMAYWRSLMLVCCIRESPVSELRSLLLPMLPRSKCLVQHPHTMTELVHSLPR